jgi:uncharacterized protein YdeI (BOF family)
MSVGQTASYVGVFVAGALAIAGIGWVTGVFPAQPQAPAASSPAPQADSAGAPAPQASATEADAREEATAIGDLTRNTFVVVAGTVERVNDEDEFALMDSTGSVRIDTGTTFRTVTPGESVTVTGFVDEDLLLEVYAQEIRLSTGEVIPITRSE